MTALRILLRQRWTLALWLVVAALFVRAVVPAGYMVDANATTLTFTICSDATGEMKTHSVAVPDDDAGAGQADNPCAFSGLGQAMLGGVDAPLLAAAILFLLALGFAPVVVPCLQRGDYLHPPAQGPPALL